jgi:hypothetical protein
MPIVEIVFRSDLITVEALGNITYGYLGAAMGYSEFMLLTGGDFADSGIVGVYRRADSEDDKANIVAGIKWFESVH